MIFAFDNMLGYILVFTRMVGMIAFNPLFSRRNVPSQARLTLVLALTIALAPPIARDALAYASTFGLVTAMIRELLVGLLCAYVFQVFYYLLFFAGDLLDMQFGMSMAKAFDPGTNIQMSVSGNLLSILFILYILATDSHLLLIRMFAGSYQVVPVGAPGLVLSNLTGFALNVFVSAFSLMIRLTLPFVAAEMVVEMSMGVLMKLIPQIHVFVINIQFKMLLGMSLLLIFAQPISDFMDRYADAMLRSIERAIQACV